MAKGGRLTRKKGEDKIKKPFNAKKYEKYILIVCEDQNTEPYYFNQFKVLFPNNTVYVKNIGTGRKPLGIVKTAIELKEQIAVEMKKNVDQVWVVFDKDDEGNNSTTLKNYNDAWSLAGKNKISIAFSNEVLELWLLLHLKDVPADMPLARNQIYEALEKEIKKKRGYKDFTYIHGKHEIIDVLQKIGDENKAVVRAEQLFDYQRSRRPINANPSTYVHLLVTKLRELIAWYSYGL